MLNQSLMGVSFLVAQLQMLSNQDPILITLFLDTAPPSDPLLTCLPSDIAGKIRCSCHFVRAVLLMQ